MDFVFNISSSMYFLLGFNVMYALHILHFIGITNILSVFLGELALHMFSISVYIMLHPFIMDYLSNWNKPESGSGSNIQNNVNSLLKDL